MTTTNDHAGRNSRDFNCNTCGAKPGELCEKTTVKYPIDKQGEKFELTDKDIDRLMGPVLAYVNHWDRKVKEAEAKGDTLLADCYRQLSEEYMELWTRLFNENKRRNPGANTPKDKAVNDKEIIEDPDAVCAVTGDYRY